MSFSSLFHLMILIYATFVLCCLPFSRGGSNETDRLALLQIKDRITSDPLGVMGSWNDSLHFCEWQGVICGHRHSRVIALYLNSSKLTGTISPFVGNLSFLRVLSLYNNSMTGIVPPEIGSLHKLQYLWLPNNSFGGEIPSNISGCSDLIQLAVSDNKLVGAIPPAIGSLIHLKFLSVANNALTGIIPSSLSNLTSLSELYMYQNGLSGSIPGSLGTLEKLTVLSMSQNKFSGTLPSSVFNLSFLMALDFGDNHLEGSLPFDFGNMLPNLQYFSIADNQFSGSIPASISNSSNLDSLLLSSNHLKGQVPLLNKLERLGFLDIFNNFLGAGQVIDLEFVSSLANATTVLTLDIGKNNFRGTFPSIICNFSMLSFLRLSGNEITGQIPDCIGNLGSLQTLSLAYNRLFGAIPLGIGKLKSLGYLYLPDNQLSGNIPSSIGNLTQLTALFLHANNLEGPIPSALGNCSYLLRVILSQNNLSGGIPPQLLSLSALVDLNLSHNPLTGSLPSEVGKLRNLLSLSVSDTKLSGELPSTLGSCLSLEHLYMQRNFFHGAIPAALATLKALLELDLSYNNLSGEIPKYLTSFPLQVLNLSYNDLKGEVPIGGVFTNVEKFSIAGNNKLCGGISVLKLPPCNFNKTQGKRLPHKLRLVIALLSGVFGLIMFTTIVSLYFFCHKKRRKEPMAESDNMLPNVSYQSLVKATNGFSSENLIGSGTFGVVYKGTLDQDQTTVAIKVFNLGHSGATKSFIAECEVLRNVRHRNLVRVITACSSLDHQGNDFKALVFGYMVNGSLEDWLHQKPTHGAADGSSDAPRNLNALKRLDIAVDVAFVLQYLHHHSGAPIVHCDLKPSNVLLDDELVAHVGDFGLAKFLSNGISSTCASQSSSVGVRGTIGYAPPEYGLGSELSTHGDVYSFGILLLEMFTGKRPTDDMFKEGITLRDYVKAASPNHVMEILDHTLLKDIVGEETNTTYNSQSLSRRGHGQMILEALTLVLRVAVSCSSELPQERLDMIDIAAKLSSIKNKLLGTLLRQLRGNPIVLQG